MNKKYNLRLDLQFRCNNSTIKFNQFDNNTSDFFMSITNGGKLVDIEKALVVLATTKPSGKVSSQFVEVKNGVIYADLKSNMRDEIGVYTAQAMLILEDKRVITDTVNYEVNESKIISAFIEDAETQEDYVLLTDMLSKLSTIEISEEQRIVNEAERILSEENRKIEEAKRVEAELVRQHEEADRTKYDAIRESNENIRKINEEARISNENVRFENEANRIEQEANRVKAEQLRKDNYNFMTEDEEKRRSEANAHKEAEVLRVQAETNRVNEEAKRRTSEQARVSAENTRISNENTRKANEVTRKNNETQRIEAETQRQNRYNSFILDAEANASNFENYTNTAKAKEEERKSNELDRKSQEDKRVSNEVERIFNENTRKANEVTRIESEKQRADAENLRKEKIIEIQSDYDSLKKVIIDKNVSVNLQNQINSVNSQLAQKANKNEVFSMANMGQDVKEAMTGGSVAVVGENTILEENIVRGQITPPTTSFLKCKGNLLDNSYFKISKGKYLNGNTGEIGVATDEKYVVIENFITVEVGKTYVFNSNVGYMYCYDSAYNFVDRVLTTDCSSVWKRATVPEGIAYVRFYCDTSKGNYKNFYFFEYDTNLNYKDIMDENLLPVTEYYIEKFTLDDEQINSLSLDIVDSIKNGLPTKISDCSKLILNGCKVKLIGDSITAGQGGSDFNSNFNTSGGELITDKIWKKTWYTNEEGYCWANNLKDYLVEKFGCIVKNYGCPGIGIDQMLLAIDDLVRDEDELVICMIGTNNRHNLQINEYYAKLVQLYETITIEKGKKCIMMSSMPASVENELSSNRIFHAEDIDNMHFKLSCEKNIEYISIYKEIIKYCDTKGINIDTLLTSDGLHPNDKGYDVMFMIICTLLGFAPKRNGATW